MEGYSGVLSDQLDSSHRKISSHRGKLNGRVAFGNHSYVEFEEFISYH